jgi:hypothetical protein
MPVDSIMANLYIQLGIAGATLLILLVFVLLLFRFIGENERSKNTSDESRVDKLSDKIDALITSNAEHTQKLNEVLLSNDKDQKVLIRTLDKVQASLEEILKKVVRIDDRTYSCLGNYKKNEEESKHENNN